MTKFYKIQYQNGDYFINKRKIKDHDWLTIKLSDNSITKAKVILEDSFNFLTIVYGCESFIEPNLNVIRAQFDDGFTKKKFDKLIKNERRKHVNFLYKKIEELENGTKIKAIKKKETEV